VDFLATLLPHYSNPQDRTLPITRKKVALVACMRKLLAIVNAVLNQTPYPLEVTSLSLPLTFKTVASSCPYSPNSVEGVLGRLDAGLCIDRPLRATKMASKGLCAAGTGSTTSCGAAQICAGMQKAGALYWPPALCADATSARPRAAGEGGAPGP
jgi:hypothetical protein